MQAGWRFAQNAAVTVVCLFLTYGCATDVNTLYPGYHIKMKSIDRIVAFSNVTFLSGAIGSKPDLDLVSSLDIAKTLDDSLKKTMTEKGYDLYGNFYFVRLGDISVYDRLQIMSADTISLNNQLLPKDPDFFGSEHEVRIISDIFDDLSLIPQKSGIGEPSDKILSVLRLDGLRLADAYLFFQVSSRELGLFEQIVHNILTFVLTFGQGPIGQTDSYLNKACLVNARTGEIIWMNAVRRRIDVGSRGNQKGLIKDILSQLPDR